MSRFVAAKVRDDVEGVLAMLAEYPAGDADDVLDALIAGFELTEGPWTGDHEQLLSELRTR